MLFSAIGEPAVTCREGLQVRRYAMTIKSQLILEVISSSKNNSYQMFWVISGKEMDTCSHSEWES